MKCGCLVCAEGRPEAMAEAEAEPRLDESSALANGIGKSGDSVDGEGLGSPTSAIALRVRKGRVMTTDGPFAETKEQLRLR
jgi:hypothetical protein